MKLSYGWFTIVLSFLFTINTLAEVTFTKVGAGAIGEDALNCLGIAWGDYDGDGFVDLFASCSAYHEANRLYHNEGDGTFTRVLDGGIADDLLRGDPAVAAWADFENDGDLDLYVAYYAFYDQPQADRLYLNNGDGTFTRGGQDWITIESTVAPTWGDFDNDGLLDLFVTRHREGACILYHHQPDGSMLPIEVPVGWNGMHCYGTTISDVDLDGDIDLLIASEKVLFQNKGDLVFAHKFAYKPSEVHGIGAADYDNDGDPDIAVAAMGEPCRLYQNNQVRDLTIWTQLRESEFPSTDPAWTATVLWGDYDNDGYVDLLIPTATHPDYFDEFPHLEGETNRLYHNEGDGTFALVTEGPLITDYGMSGGGGWADYDNDGDLDVALSDGQGMGNDQVPAAPVALYRNDGGNENNWLTLTLVGTNSNRSAIGAKVYAYANINGVDLQQMREVASFGYWSQNDMRVHFGLGDAEVVDTLRIEWPSGIVQEMQDVAAKQFLTIEEEVSEAPTWAGYPIANEAMDVDTEGFMGWINVYHGDYVWCYAMNGWLYCPEANVGESGAWVYMPK